MLNFSTSKSHIEGHFAGALIRKIGRVSINFVILLVLCVYFFIIRDFKI